MKAMILAAGIGSRLRPMTDHTPKALVKINGIPLIEIVIRRLMASGYNEMIINLHHLGGQIKDFVVQQNYFGQHIEFSDESDKLLDTGGGLQKASWFFNDGQPFLVHNVDIITDLDLDALRLAHMKNKALATLAVRHRDTSRYFLFDQEQRLKGWTNHKTGETKPMGAALQNTEEIAFSGVQIVEPEIFQFMKIEGAYSLTHLYLDLCNTHVIKGYVHNNGYWNDVGKHEELSAAEAWFKNKNV